MRRCVYVHFLNGSPVYVGSGTEPRPTARQWRSDEHLKSFDEPSFEIKIIKDGLTEREAKALEQEYMDDFIAKGFKLFNRAKKTCQVLKMDKEELSKSVYYDEGSPTKLRWTSNVYGGRNNKAATIKKDQVAGSLPTANPKIRYMSIRIKDKSYLIHRVVWVLHNGEIPEEMVIDHIDGNKQNNLISNLRCVTASGNCRNRKFKASNTGFQSISESLGKGNRCRSGNFTVSWTEEIYKNKSKGFTFGPQSLTREEAFAKALEFRNNLVDLGIIQITTGR